METDSTTSLPHPAEVASLEERELVFSAYLEGDLSTDEQRAFDERLDTDPDFREAYGEFTEFMDSVQNMSYEFAPPDFAGRVRTRIRVRSRGRFFADNLLQKQRVPYEVIAVVMIVIMASAYLLMGAPPDHSLRHPGDKQLEVPPSPQTTPQKAEP